MSDNPDGKSYSKKNDVRALGVLLKEMALGLDKDPDNNVNLYNNFQKSQLSELSQDEENELKEKNYSPKVTNLIKTLLKAD